MSSGGSTGMPATPAPTPFSLGPCGIRPEDLVAGISRLSVIQELDTASHGDPAVAISVHEASGHSAGNTSNLSNYFGTPQSSGDSVFDTLATPSGRACRSRAGSEGQGSFQDVRSQAGFQDVTIGTPAKAPRQAQGEDSLPSPALAASPSPSPSHLLPSPQPSKVASSPLLQPSPLPERPESPARKSPTGEEAVLEAWIPIASTREALVALADSPATFFPNRDQLTCPGVLPGSEQGDPVREAVAKYQGEGEAVKRHILTSDGVTSDLRGLDQLLAAGNYRAAVNHTAGLLELYGQGRGRAGQTSKHSPTSMQVWWVRLALLVKLRQFTVAEAEAAALGDLDRPDLYYQYYPELHPGRRGSIAPWTLRLLLAELPVHCGKQVARIGRFLVIVNLKCVYIEDDLFSR